MLVTLRNDFHGTETKVKAGKLSPATVKRVQKALCGMDDCSCSNSLGVRGQQECEVIQEYDSFTGQDTFTVRNKRRNKKMTRTEMIQQLKEIGSLALDSKEIEDLMYEVYFYLEEKFKSFVNDPNNTATKEELQDFQNGEYLVEILFKEDEVVYFVGADAQQLANEPRWGEDGYDDIETETLAALLKAAQ